MAAHLIARLNAGLTARLTAHLTFDRSIDRSSESGLMVGGLSGPGGGGFFRVAPTRLVPSRPPSPVSSCWPARSESLSESPVRSGFHPDQLAESRPSHSASSHASPSHFSPSHFNPSHFPPSHFSPSHFSPSLFSPLFKYLLFLSESRPSESSFRVKSKSPLRVEAVQVAIFQHRRVISLRVISFAAFRVCRALRPRPSGPSGRPV